MSADPALGDYLPMSEDDDDLPGQGGVFNPINLNPYCYAGNNPVKYVDPDGGEMTITIGGVTITAGAVFLIAATVAAITYIKMYSSSPEFRASQKSFIDGLKTVIHNAGVETFTVTVNVVNDYAEAVAKNDILKVSSDGDIGSDSISYVFPMGYNGNESWKGKKLGQMKVELNKSIPKYGGTFNPKDPLEPDKKGKIWKLIGELLENLFGGTDEGPPPQF